LQNVVREVDKNVQLLFWGAGLSLSSVGLIWMITTLVSVDKRTEVMDVKIDHLVQSVEELSERKLSLDKSWTNIIPSIQVTSEAN
jgi:hypothetical protein